MYNLLAADLFKARKSASLWILLGVTAACAVAMTAITHLLSLGKLDANFGGIGFLFSDVNVISIIGGVAAGVFICGDFDSKVINDAVASGSSRFSVVFGKAVFLCLTTAFLLLPYLAAAAAALGSGAKFTTGGQTSLGFLDLITRPGAAFSAAEIGKFIAASLTIIIVYLGQLSICVPLSLLLKKPVPVVAVCYSVSIISGTLSGFEQKFSVFKNVIAFTPYSSAYMFTNLSTGAAGIAKAIGASLFFFALMCALTYGFFRKAEIK